MPNIGHEFLIPLDPLFSLSTHDCPLVPVLVENRHFQGELCGPKLNKSNLSSKKFKGRRLATIVLEVGNLHE